MASAEPGRKAPYSNDIRWRVVWQRVGMELPFNEIAKHLNIATSTAHSIYHRFQNTGDVSATQPPKRESLRKLNSRDELLVIGLVLENPSLYLGEICHNIREILGKSVSAPTVCRLLARHGFTRKKIQQVAKQRSEQLRAAFQVEVSCYSRAQLVWVDETGCNARDHTRHYGYALRGQAPIYHRFLHRGKRVSAIAALAKDGIVAVDCHHGSVNAEVFADFIRGSLIPSMQSYDGETEKSIALMDNCSIHHTDIIAQLFRDVGIVLMFLPPYSPDLNPIEEAFTSVKAYLKRHDELMQALDDPIPVIKAAFNNITKEDSEGWITHAGYTTE